MQMEETIISVHLSRVLDEIGLNELTVKQRRETNLYIDNSDSVYYEIFKNMTVHTLGSQVEGTTTPGLKSDVDCLHVHHQLEVIQDLKEWKKGQFNLLMLLEDTVPGYCRLQLLKRDRPEPEETLPGQHFTYIGFNRVTLPGQHYTYDECNRVILTNSVFDYIDTDYKHMNRNGPAQTWQGPDYCDCDLTYAYQCTSRLEASEKWARRKRRGGWPAVSVIQQAVNAPFFLVPVGYKLSLTKSIEWRLSTSLAERYLIFSLNIVQIKCFVILKILMKTYVMPKFGKRVSSYHCKTALLYCMESTEADFWREDNLLQCIHRCLEMLLAWVTDKLCPHFIIAKANLFAGKVTAENTNQIQSVLHNLIHNVFNVKSILEVNIDGLGPRLLKKLGTLPNDSPILDSIESFDLLGILEIKRRLKTGMHDAFIELSLCNLVEASTKILKAITTLNSRTNSSHKFQQEANGQVKKFLSSLVGSFLASSALGRHERIHQKVIDLLDTSATSDISYLLKQALVFYCSGQLEKVIHLCENIEGRFKQYIIFPVCDCYLNEFKFSSEQHITMYTKRLKVRFARCVMFTPHEIHCIPQALRHELSRAVCDEDIQERRLSDKWMMLAVVDCLPLLYYLQYMTHRDLDNDELKVKSLNNLEICIRDESHLMNHVETAWNILGQCYEMENQPVAALHCYRKSLDIRPRNNAANWISFYRCIQGVYRLCDGLIDDAIIASPLFAR